MEVNENTNPSYLLVQDGRAVLFRIKSQQLDGVTDRDGVMSFVTRGVIHKQFKLGLRCSVENEERF